MISTSLKYLSAIRSFTTRVALNTHKEQRPPIPRMARSNIKQQNFDYFLVLDFEATCDEQRNPEPQEIIEFPVLKVSGKTFEVESTFHLYVQPVVHKEISAFCTQLTGIIQDMVDGQPDLQQTLVKLDQWMVKENLCSPEVKSVFVTCGDWDLKTMLPSQCNHFKLPYPDYLKQWINIKKPYANVTGSYPRSLMLMLKDLKLSHIGRHHSGIDDCKNIANILKALAQTGCVFKQTGQRS